MSEPITITLGAMPDGKGWTPDFGGHTFTVIGGVVTFDDGETWDQNKQGPFLMRAMYDRPKAFNPLNHEQTK